MCFSFMSKLLVMLAFVVAERTPVLDVKMQVFYVVQPFGFVDFTFQTEITAG